jgi:hypothetical protein
MLHLFLQQSFIHLMQLSVLVPIFSLWLFSQISLASTISTPKWTYLYMCVLIAQVRKSKYYSVLLRVEKNRHYVYKILLLHSVGIVRNS